MKSTGIIRKIDELGRIVIPKSIRNTMSINDEEDIEIYLDDDNIILKKYCKLEIQQDKIINFIKVLEKDIDGIIVLTDREKVIYSNLKELIQGTLNKNYKELINNRKKIEENNFVTFCITENTLNGKYIFLPIIINTDLLGSLVLLNSKEINSKSKSIFESLFLLIKSEIEG